VRSSGGGMSGLESVSGKKVPPVACSSFGCSGGAEAVGRGGSLLIAPRPIMVALRTLSARFSGGALVVARGTAAGAGLVEVADLPAGAELCAGLAGALEAARGGAAEALPASKALCESSPRLATN